MDRRRSHRPLYQIDPKPVHHKKEKERGGKVHLVNADSLVSMVQEMCSEVATHSQRLNRLEMRINDSLVDMENEVVSNTNTKIETLSNKMLHWEQQLRQTTTTSLLHAKQLQGKIDQLSYEMSAAPSNKMADSYSGVHEEESGSSAKQMDRLFGFCKLIQRDILDIANEQSRISDVNTQLESDIQTVRIHLDSLATSPTGVGLSTDALRDIEVRLAKVEAKHQHQHHHHHRHHGHPHRSQSNLSLKRQPLNQPSQPLQSEPTISSVLDMLDEDDMIRNTPPELLPQPARAHSALLLPSDAKLGPGAHHQTRRGSGTSSAVSKPRGGHRNNKEQDVIEPKPQPQPQPQATVVESMKQNQQQQQQQQQQQLQQPQEQPEQQQQQQHHPADSKPSAKRTDVGSASSHSTAVPSGGDVADKSSPRDDDDNDSSHRRKLEIESLLNQARAERKAQTSAKDQEVLGSLGLADISEGGTDDDGTSSLPGMEEIEAITPPRSSPSTRRQLSSGAGIGESPSPQFVDLDDSDPFTSDDE